MSGVSLLSAIEIAISTKKTTPVRGANRSQRELDNLHLLGDGASVPPPPDADGAGALAG